MTCSLTLEQRTTWFLKDSIEDTTKMNRWLLDDQLNLNSVSETWGISPLEGLTSIMRWKITKQFIEKHPSLLSQDSLSSFSVALNWQNKKFIFFLVSQTPKLDIEIPTLEKEMPFTILWHAIIFASRSCKVAKKIIEQNVNVDQKSENGHTIFQLLEPDEKMKQQYASLAQKLKHTTIPRLYGAPTESQTFLKRWVDIPDTCKRIQQLAEGKRNPFAKILEYLKNSQSNNKIKSL